MSLLIREYKHIQNNLDSLCIIIDDLGVIQTLLCTQYHKNINAKKWNVRIIILKTNVSEFVKIIDAVLIITHILIYIYTVHYVVIQNQFICRNTFLWNINFFNIFLILNILHIICCFIPCSIHDFLYRLRLNFAAIKQIQRGPLCLLPTCSRQSNISCKITCNHGTCLVHTHFSFQGLIPSVIS